MTLLGGEPPKINTGAISPGVISASSIRLTRLDAHGTPLARNYNITLQNPLRITYTVDNVSPEVVAILTGTPQGETLL